MEKTKQFKIFINNNHKNKIIIDNRIRKLRKIPLDNNKLYFVYNKTTTNREINNIKYRQIQNKMHL